MRDARKCNLCGDCLVKCLYVDYEKDKAIAQIKALTKGKEAEVLIKRVTCSGCLEYCPTGADPYDLILKAQEKFHAFPIDIDARAGTDLFTRFISLSRPTYMACTPSLAEYLVKKTPELLGPRGAGGMEASTFFPSSLVFTHTSCGRCHPNRGWGYRSCPARKDRWARENPPHRPPRSNQNSLPG